MQGASASQAVTDLKSDMEDRLRDLEAACKDNGDLLRESLSRDASAATPAMEQSLQDLHSQVRCILMHQQMSADTDFGWPCPEDSNENKAHTAEANICSVAAGPRSATPASAERHSKHVVVLRD